MQKVVTVNLNGNAYSLEEPGFDALRTYLQRAQARLTDNPDRAEIMADLEQAIAEKCARFLGSHKTVVTSAEIETILAEMGPVENADERADTVRDAPKAESQGAPPRDADAPKRLYQIREGAMLTGVCNGLAAFFNVDVTLVRIIFVILAICTAGAWVLVYIGLAFIVPYADTSEDRAAAYGLPFNAEELISQAKLHHAHFKARHAWRRQWRREQRAWHRHWHRQWRHVSEQAQMAATPPAPSMGYVGNTVLGISLPFIAVVSAALFVVWAFAMISLLTTGAIFGWPLPPGVPLWAGVVILVALHILVTAPLRAARFGGPRHWGTPAYGAWAALYGVLWIAFTAIFFWFAYLHIPQIHALIERLPEIWTHVTTGITV